MRIDRRYISGRRHHVNCLSNAGFPSEAFREKRSSRIHVLHQPHLGHCDRNNRSDTLGKTPRAPRTRAQKGSGMLLRARVAREIERGSSASSSAERPVRLVNVRSALPALGSGSSKQTFTPKGATSIASRGIRKRPTSRRDRACCRQPQSDLHRKNLPRR
jgi:hypothetical protein